MSRAFREFYKKRLKSSRSTEELIGAVIELKSSQPTEELIEIVSVLREGFKGGKLRYDWLGKKNIKDLAWMIPHVVPSFEIELRFSRVWISSFAKDINLFIRSRVKIQNKILEGKFEESLNELDVLINKFGWSIWALELRLAVLTLSSNQEECRNFISQVSSGSKNRLIGLILQILKDRNDIDISLDSFISKCNNSFPKLSVADEVKKYLVYRSYGVIKNAKNDLPSILGIDFLNSIIDYYESFVDGIGLMVMSGNGSDYLREIGELIDDISNSGIIDHRLHKLQFILSGKVTPISSEFDWSLSKLVKDLMVDKKTNITLETSGIISEIEKNIVDLNNPEEKDLLKASDFFKFGINIRGVDVGNAIVDFSETIFNNPYAESIFPVWAQFLHPEIGIEEFLGLPADLTLSGISYIASSSHSSELRLTAAALIKSLDDNESVYFKEGYAFFWLIKVLIEKGSLEKVEKLIGHAENFSPKWKLDYYKAKIAYLIELKHYEEAIDQSLSIILSEFAIPSELPNEKIFFKKKWKDLSAINYFKLALIAHFSCSYREDLDAKYFCRVACRLLKSSGIIENIGLNSEKYSETEKSIITNFLRDVWVEDNLTHVGFSTTQEMRQERIRVLQILLQFDSARESEYANEIKTLTFDELMWKGIRQVNETRIFVNESAIARWAEKELNDDFNRWKKIILLDQKSENVVDDLLRQYLSGGEARDFKYPIENSQSTEADIIIYGIANRLLEKFLFDTADGLDSYLSSRIRHGTLKGTMLGPLEEAGLIGANDTFLLGGSAFLPQGLAADVVSGVASALKSFEISIEKIIKNLITDVIRINSQSSPGGKIKAILHPVKSGVYLSPLMRDCTFHQFTQTCFDIFWQILQPSLAELAHYFKNEVKNTFQIEFDKLINRIREIDVGLDSAIDKVTKISTQTQAQIEIVSNWFQSDRKIDQQIFRLSEAVDVAVSVTKNVYRFFSACAVDSTSEVDIPLTSLGLLGVTDCLYILLENAWKHSGFGVGLKSISIRYSLENNGSILVFSISNPLSQERLKIVNKKFVEDICSKFGSDDFNKMASKENGSGFAKLTKLAKSIGDRPDVPMPQVILNDGIWLVKVSIPIYQRGEAYDAYFE